MAFDLSEFKSNISKEGYLKPHSYQTFITIPSSVENGNQLRSNFRFRTESINMPGAAFLTASNYKPHGYGKTYEIPYAYLPQEVTCVHVLDQNASDYEVYWNWMNYVNDFAENRTHYAEYYDNIKATIIISIYENENGKSVKEIKLNEVFPLNYSQTELSWNSTAELTKLTVTYRYVDYEVINKGPTKPRRRIVSSPNGGFVTITE